MKICGCEKICFHGRDNPLCDWVECAQPKAPDSIWCRHHTPYSGKVCIKAACFILAEAGSCYCSSHEYKETPRCTNNRPCTTRCGFGYCLKPTETLEQKVARLDTELKKAKADLDEKNLKDHEAACQQMAIEFIDVCPRAVLPFGRHQWVCSKFDISTHYTRWPERQVASGTYHCKCGASAEIKQ